MMGSWLNIVIGTTLFQVLSSQGRDEGTRGIEKKSGEVLYLSLRSPTISRGPPQLFRLSRPTESLEQAKSQLTLPLIFQHVKGKG